MHLTSVFQEGGVFHDIQIAARRLVMRPGYTALILLTLAVGIGAATAVFSVVDQTILRPAPFTFAHRLVDVLHVNSVLRTAVRKATVVLSLMTAFSLVALLLTAAGIFGVLSQAVAQRTREIGIRVALGATPANVMRLVISRGMILTAIGLTAGVAGALSLVRTLRALLYGVSPSDPASFAVVTFVLLGVALIACWLPTRAAMRVQPAVALRVE